MAKQQATPPSGPRVAPITTSISPPSRVLLTENEQKLLLKEYIMTPQEFWPLIRYNSRLAYIEKTSSGEAKFNYGGLVAENPIIIPPSTDRRGIKLQNLTNKKIPAHTEWLVPYDTIIVLYMKMTIVNAIAYDELKLVVNSMNNNFRKVLTRLKAMESRVDALERRSKREKK